MGPECQFLGLTAPRPHRPLSDSGRQCLARAHGLSAVVSPPTISTLPRCRRPLPLAAVKGAHPHCGAPFLPPPPSPPPPTTPPFLPPLSHHGQPAPASLQLIRPCPEHRAAVYNLLAPRAVDLHPQTPSPPPFPFGRPHLTIECILPVSSSLSPPQNGFTTLPPCSPDPPR
jgi:hypothetical protein